MDRSQAVHPACLDGTPVSRRTVLAGVVVAITLSACSAPEPPDAAPTVDTEDDLTARTPDPARDELVVTLDRMTDTVAAAREELADGGNTGASAALELLLDEPTTDADGQPSLFPAVSTERGASGDQDDLLSATLSLAREAGGTLGRDVVETLRDPVAGDLGAWERDAEGVIADLESTVDGIADLDDANDAVAQMDGDGTRALAWTMLATSTTDTELADAAAERAHGHLGVVAIALTLLEEQVDDDAA